MVSILGIAGNIPLKIGIGDNPLFFLAFSIKQ